MGVIFLMTLFMSMTLPHKALGILGMFGSLLVLFLIPYNNTSYIRNTTHRPIFKVFLLFISIITQEFGKR